jgi:membrane fusion protein, multidrug efflux system
MKLRPKFLIPIGVVLALAAIVGYRIFSSGSGVDTRRQGSPQVKLDQAKREEVRYTLRFTGDVAPIQQASIFSKVSGNLERVYVEMGMQVRQNQVLALIDTTELHQQFLQASATYENARLTNKRTQELFEQNLVSQQDKDNAETSMKVSGAAFETARTRLAYARITAPFPGTVTHRFLDPGALVTPNNSTLFSLMDLDQMKIIANVLEKDIPLVKPGKEAVITVDAYPERQFFGRIARLSEAVDPSTRTMAIEIDIPNRDHLLKPGMFANATLIVDIHRDALTVPTVALLKDDQGSFVYTVVRDTARQIRVTTGVEQEERTEITGGIKGTIDIITTGQQFVRDGGPVMVQR